MTSFVAFAQHVWKLFVAERKSGWKNLGALFAICSSVSLIANVLLFLAGYSLLMDYPTISVVAFIFPWITLSIGLCFFRCLRCFVALFFLSCGLREGRNSLIAAGTGIVVAGNIQNIFHNLKQLANSVTCILQSQRFTFLRHYIKAIWWVYSQTKVLSNPFKDVVSLDDKLNVSYSVSDEDVKLRTNKTILHIQNVADQISSILTLQSCLGKKVLPLLGTAFILLGTYLFLRKFLSPHNLKFKNTYITKEFIRYNEGLWQHRKRSVLPLSKEERKVYTMVPAFCQTHKERKCTARFFLPVLANLCIWALFAAVDYLLYWLIFSVSKHLQDFPELEVHLKLYYHAAVFDLFNSDQRLDVRADLWAYQRDLQEGILLRTPAYKGYNPLNNAYKFIFNNGEIADNKTSFKIPLFEQSCIPKPGFSLSATWTQLGAIIFSLTVLGLLTSTLTQLKILVTTSFFPSTDMKRIQYLHKKLLNRRSKLSEGNVKRKPNSFARLHFWFPILKTMRNPRKKERDVAKDSSL